MSKQDRVEEVEVTMTDERRLTDREIDALAMEDGVPSGGNGVWFLYLALAVVLLFLVILMLYYGAR